MKIYEDLFEGIKKIRKSKTFSIYENLRQANLTRFRDLRIVLYCVIRKNIRKLKSRIYMRGFIIDLKTCKEAGERKFKIAMSNYYDISPAPKLITCAIILLLLCEHAKLRREYQAITTTTALPMQYSRLSRDDKSS